MPGFVVCGPNEAIVVSGAFHSKPLIQKGGRVFVWPVIQKVQRLSLNVSSLSLESKSISTRDDLPVTVSSVALVKINSSNIQSLKKACELFLDKTIEETMDVAKNVLECCQHVAISNMSLAELFQNRSKLASQTLELAKNDLDEMGFEVASLTIHDIEDELGYMDHLKRKKIAEFKKDIRIRLAESECNRIAGESSAEKDKILNIFVNYTRIMEIRHGFDIMKLNNAIELSKEKAKADLAYRLQSAIVRQKIKDEEMEVKLIEKNQSIILEDCQNDCTRKILQAEVEKPTEIEALGRIRLKQALGTKIVLEAQAESEAMLIKNQSESQRFQKKIEKVEKIISDAAVTNLSLILPNNEETKDLDEFKDSAKIQKDDLADMVDKLEKSLNSIQSEIQAPDISPEIE